MYVHRLHEFTFMETILYFKCKYRVRVPFITSKLFPKKYLGIQKQWGNEECSLGRYELHTE